MAQPIGVIAVIAWFWAGMFAKLLAAGGLVEGLIWVRACASLGKTDRITISI